MQERQQPPEELRSRLPDRQAQADGTERARGVQLGREEIQPLLLGAAPRRRHPVIQTRADDRHPLSDRRETDDGTSVADPWPRAWGFDNLVVGGNAMIPTANTVNPTLMSTAIAVRGARRVIAQLRGAEAVSTR